MSEKKDNTNTDEIDQIMAELDQLQKQVPDSSAAVDPEIKEQIEEVIQAHEKETNETTALIETPAISDSTLDEIRAEASQGSKDSVSLDESFGEMKQEEIHKETTTFGNTESSHPEPETHQNVTAIYPHATPQSKPSPSRSSEGSLQMTISGNIQLDLKYAQGQDEVMLCFENGFFTVRLNNGAEFKLPLQNSEQNKKSA